METIGVKDLTSKGIGTVIFSCNDDWGEFHTKKIKNIPYFIYLPVNIVSATVFVESMKYGEGIWVLTKRKYYIFNFGKYKNKISHLENFLQ